MSTQSYFLLAGEPSGDRLGAFLGKGLIDLGYSVRGWGGPDMKTAGVDIIYDISTLGLMGWTAVVTQLSTQIRLLKKAKEDILRSGADRIILIDYGSFNLRIASWAKKKGFHITYYCPPKIWASRPKRIKYLRDCDKVIVLFPFEKDYYRAKGLEALCFGHPSAEDIVNFVHDPEFASRYKLDDRPVLGIFPGSRKEEITANLPIYLQAAKQMDHYQVLISTMAASRIYVEEVLKREKVSDAYHLVREQDYHDMMSKTNIAIVTSGTASWEAAMHGTPQIVGYKTSTLNYMIAKQLITVPYISLVNLMLDKEAVPECIQSDLNAAHLLANIILLEKPETKSEINNSYQNIRRMSHMSEILKNTMVAITS